MIMILLRTVIIYIVLIGFIRMTGKRQIGELQLSELVTTFLLSELATIPITDPDIPLLFAIVPILFLISLEIIISFIVTKCVTLKRFVDGSPSFLIKKGKIDIKELKKQRISAEELISALRIKDISSVSSIEYALLEQNGQLSAFKKDDDLEHAVIVDGRFNLYNLTLSGLSESDIRNRLKARGCVPEDIFLYTVTDNGSEFIMKKQDV